MFVLMSKKAAAAAQAPPPPAAASAASSTSRTPNACDPCKIRKSKCDGQTPCGRCRAKQLVCTSSRRSAKASGPVTEEHVAILQEQQRRLTRALSNMANVIKRAESGGFSAGEDATSSSDLSSFELAEVLQRFAPTYSTADNSTSPSDDSPPLPSKKRRVQETTHASLPANDVQMDDFPTAQPIDQNIDPFQRFLSTVQQHTGNGLNPTANSFQPSLGNFEAQQLQAFPTTGSQNMSFAPPGESSSFGFDPQMAPFMDMVDWDASLDHFLESQHNGESPDWNTDLGLQNATL